MNKQYTSSIIYQKEQKKQLIAQFPKWEQFARDRAKQRAQAKFDNYLKRLQFEGKDVSNCRATGQHHVKENGDVTYVINAVFG